MYPSKPFSSKLVMSVLAVVQGLCAVFGNGSVLAVIARFKSLRTLPNVLIANLSSVDILNAVINMPVHLISTIWETTWFRGKTLAIMASFFNRLFIVLNLASMLALMASMYFAIAFDMRYMAWRTKRKAVVSSCLIWFTCTLMVVLCSIPLFGIDLGDARVIEYRAEIYKQGKYFVAGFMALFIICGGLVGFLTIHSIKKQKKKKAQMNSRALQEQVRLQTYIKATKTIAITVAAYFMSYLPAIVYAVVGQREKSQVDSWFAFVAWNATFFSSVVNPIIYYLRTRRLRSAFKQFLKDPLGSADFKERPTGPGKEKGRRHAGWAAAKKNGGIKASGIPFPGGNKVMAAEALPAHLRIPEAEESSLDRGEKLQKRDICCSTSGALELCGPVIASSFSPVIERRGAWEMKKKTTIVEKETPSERIGMATKIGVGEESRESGLERDSEGETHFTLRGNAVHRLINDMGKIRHQADEKGEMSSKSELETELAETHPDRLKKKTMVMQNDKPCKETNAETEDEFEKVSNESGTENDFQEGKRLYSKEKINVLEITDSGKTEDSAQEEETLADYKTEEEKQPQERKNSRRNSLVPVSI